MDNNIDRIVLDKKKLKAFLEGIYYVYARRELVYPDPLWYLYKYDDVRDREIVGLIASSLAYGRVAQIMKSVERVLACLGTRPREYLLRNGESDIVPLSFKHRFTTGADMNNLLRNIRKVVKKYDTVENFADECIQLSGGELLSGLDKFAEELSKNREDKSFPLVSKPSGGSACKRLFLYLRWMVRSCDVDPGGWTKLPITLLLIPCDTHMLKISHLLHLTSRTSSDLLTAQQISSHFSSISPADPAKYDFPLTRFGIRNSLSLNFF